MFFDKRWIGIIFQIESLFNLVILVNISTVVDSADTDVVVFVVAAAVAATAVICVVADAYAMPVILLLLL